MFDLVHKFFVLAQDDLLLAANFDSIRAISRPRAYTLHRLDIRDRCASILTLDQWIKEDAQ